MSIVRTTFFFKFVRSRITANFVVIVLLRDLRPKYTEAARPFTAPFLDGRNILDRTFSN